MTKIGEGDQPPKVSTKEIYHRDLEVSALKFENALAAYNQSGDSSDKGRLKAVMDGQLKMIQQAVNEIKLKEIHKQGEKVTKDYEQYIASGSTESFDALEHDIQTLRDYNQISTPKGKP